MYIKLIGYDVNFGYTQIITLMNSKKYSEKYTGYITSAILIPEYEEQVYKTMKDIVR